MKKKTKKRSIGNTSAPAQSSPVIIKQGGGASDAVVPIILVGSAFAGYFFVVKPYLSKRAAGLAEGDTSPEGIIATRFKTVFGERGDKKTFVSDADYKAAAISLTNENQKKVYEIYSALTDRQLSDDIANHISASVKEKADKIQSYNSKPGKLFSITPENKIKFEVAPLTDYVRFAPGSTTPIKVYNHPIGIILNEIKDNDVYKKVVTKINSNSKTAPLAVSVSIKPNAKAYPVTAVKEIPISGIKSPGKEFWIFAAPYVKTRKSFAAIQILAGKTKEGKNILAWIDARDMVAYKPTSKPVKGIGNACSQLI